MKDKIIGTLMLIFGFILMLGGAVGVADSYLTWFYYDIEYVVLIGGVAGAGLVLIIGIFLCRDGIKKIRKNKVSIKPNQRDYKIVKNKKVMLFIIIILMVMSIIIAGLLTGMINFFESNENKEDEYNKFIGTWVTDDEVITSFDIDTNLSHELFSWKKLTFYSNGTFNFTSINITQHTVYTTKYYCYVIGKYHIDNNKLVLKSDWNISRAIIITNQTDLVLLKEWDSFQKFDYYFSSNNQQLTILDNKNITATYNKKNKKLL